MDLRPPPSKKQVFIDYYCPIEAGYKDRSGVLPYDKAVCRALGSSYRKPTDVTGSEERTLFVGRLPPEAEKADLEKAFGRYGELQEVRVICDLVTGASRGYAFVVFARRRDAAAARLACRRLCIAGADVVVEAEFSRGLRNWRPRRLGGGLGGKKESGQLRFGGVARPFQVPVDDPSDAFGPGRLRRTGPNGGPSGRERFSDPSGPDKRSEAFHWRRPQPESVSDEPTEPSSSRRLKEGSSHRGGEDSSRSADRTGDRSGDRSGGDRSGHRHRDRDGHRDKHRDRRHGEDGGKHRSHRKHGRKDDEAEGGGWYEGGDGDGHGDRYSQGDDRGDHGDKRSDSRSDRSDRHSAGRSDRSDRRSDKHSKRHRRHRDSWTPGADGADRSRSESRDRLR